MSARMSVSGCDSSWGKNCEFTEGGWLLESLVDEYVMPYNESPKLGTDSMLGAAGWGDWAFWLGWKEAVDAEIGCWTVIESAEGIALKGASPNGSSNDYTEENKFI